MPGDNYNPWAAVTTLAALILVISVVRLALSGSVSKAWEPLPLIVEVRGNVKKPGVYILRNPSATVADALEAAGCCDAASSGTDSSPLFYRKIRNGQLIQVVNSPADENKIEIRLMDAAPRITLGVKLDLNRATENELLLVPQMKPQYATAIVTRRTRSPWMSVDGLRQIEGVGAKTVETWKDYLEVTGE